ncbi:MAG: precorrin-2 C(20)-methyltransferase [Eubacteriaceae bacterium]|nr:precorrin-2 C(20)-methyltransferase [Eubacteriaceae bacterium]
MTQQGTLYGIGVGPGDPELITAKAINLLGEIDIILTPITREGKESKAYTIAKSYLRKDAVIHELEFPMVNLRTHKESLEAKWAENSSKVAALLSQGKNLAILTIGDPMVYSTYSYMIPYLNELGIKLVTVPGITSFCASAAVLNIPICQGNESFCVLTDIQDKKDLENALDHFQDIVIMKATPSIDIINSVVEERMLHDKIYAVTDCGGPNETVSRGLLPEDIGYFTLIIIKNNRSA